MAQHSKLVSALDKHQAFVSEVPKEVRVLLEQNQRRKEASKKQDLDFSELPAGLSENLLPFQWKGIEFALEHEGKLKLIFQPQHNQVFVL